MRPTVSRALLPALCLLAWASAKTAWAEAPLEAAAQAPTALAGPFSANPSLAAALAALRDAVYEDLSPAQAQPLAERAAALAATLPPQGLGPGLAELARARADYYFGRLLNEYGEKSQAIARFESALSEARAATAAGAGNPALLAEAQTLSQLCTLKDLVFLVANGPKVLQIAKKILDTEQNNPGASLILAQAKAFAPPIFGGNPSDALASLDALAAAHPQGLEKDELFDLRVCRATALERLGRRAEAAAAYRSALQLYPGNRYARDGLGKLGG